MPKKRKDGAYNTTISIRWSDKNSFRRLAKKVKTTKNGDVYETDAVIFSRVLEDYLKTHRDEIGIKTTSTYPLNPQDKSQQGYSLEESS